MELIFLLTILAIGIIAGSYGALVGGHSLLTLPILLILGISPHTAIATNAFGVIGASIAGWYKFHKKKLIDYKVGIFLAIPAIIGAAIGSNFVSTINETLLKQTIGILTVILLALVLLNPEKGVKQIKHKITLIHYAAIAIISLLIGVYGSFYIAAIGTFFTYSLILLLGFTFLESAATNKIAVTAINLTVTAIFISKNLVDYQLGLVLFLGTFIGAWIGVHYSDKLGNKWIKWLFATIILISAAKVLLG